VDDDGQALLRIGAVVARLLGPHVEDKGALFVGPLVTALVRTFPGQLAGGGLQNFLAAVIRRLCSATLRSLVQSLLTVVAHVVMADHNGFVRFLASADESQALLPPGSLENVMQVWLVTHARYQGGLERKVSACALGTLLVTEEAALASVVFRPPPAMAAAGKIVELEAAPGRPLWQRLCEVAIEEAWRDVIRCSVEAATEQNNDSEDEEEEDGQTLYDLCGLPSSHGFMPGDDSTDEDDQIHEIDLQQHLLNAVSQFASRERQLFHAVFSQLPHDKQQFLKARLEGFQWQ